MNTKTVLAETDLSDLELGDADFTGAWLNGAYVWNIRTKNAIFREADLGLSDDPRPEADPRTLFSKSELAGADFTKANMVGAIFENTNLAGARFEGACLRGADLTKAIGLQADQFQQAYVSGAHFPPAVGKLVRGLPDACPSRP